MSQIDDAKKAFFLSEGIPAGAVPEMYVAWLQTVGATSSVLDDARFEYMVSLGFLTGTLTDREGAWLTSLGHTGTINDKFLSGWTAGIPSAGTDLFSVDIGTGLRSVSNGVDFDGEGGLVLSKSRANSEDWQVYDTLRGVTKKLNPNLTVVESTDAQGVTAFNSSGFDIGTSVTGSAVSYSFRQAPSFCQVITYTGNSSGGRTIAHNLGVTPGMVIVTSRSNVDSWYVQHISRGGTKHLLWNFSDAEALGGTIWSNISASSTHVTLGGSVGTNGIGRTYVMYVFAHDPSAEGIIQCGQYTGNGNVVGPSINLGWKPRFLMIKLATGAGSWYIADTARGFGVGIDSLLSTDTPDIENVFNQFANPTATGFDIDQTWYNSLGQDYIYMAIREE